MVSSEALTVERGRHKPHERMPGPSRSITHPWGLPRNSEAEAAKCYTDDVLLFRMILLQVVAQMGRDVRLGQDSKLKLNPKVCFLLEQPAEPHQEPTCASFWRMGEWKALKTILGLELVTFNQGLRRHGTKTYVVGNQLPVSTSGAKVGGARGPQTPGRSHQQGSGEMGSGDDERDRHPGS